VTYWLAFPLVLFMLGPIWLDRWGGSYVGDRFQMAVEEAWGADTAREAGQFRSSEGMIGPPRN